MVPSERHTEYLPFRLHEWAAAVEQFAITEGGDLRHRLLEVARRLQQTAEAAERPLV